MVWNLPTENFIPAVFFLTLALPEIGFAESVNSKMREGISQYHEGGFKESVENFSSARTDHPEDSRIIYNLGNAYYKEGKFQEALQAYIQSALDEKNPDIKKKSIYNTGNAMVKLGKMEEAESVYKKVLALDPSDMDAKYNLEYVRQQLKNKEEQKQDSRKNQQEGDPSEKEQAENQESDQQEGNPPPPFNPVGSENKENSGPPEESAMEAELSRHEAERMLEGLTEDLKNISRMQAGKTKPEYQGNDW